MPFCQKTTERGLCVWWHESDQLVVDLDHERLALGGHDRGAGETVVSAGMVRKTSKLNACRPYVPLARTPTGSHFSTQPMTENVRRTPSETVGRNGAVYDVEGDELRRLGGRGQNSRAAHRVEEGQKEERGAEVHFELCANSEWAGENASRPAELYASISHDTSKLASVATHAKCEVGTSWMRFPQVEL